MNFDPLMPVIGMLIRDEKALISELLVLYYPSPSIGTIPSYPLILGIFTLPYRLSREDFVDGDAIKAATNTALALDWPC
jgi:hypothetical protein